MSNVNQPWKTRALNEFPGTSPHDASRPHHRSSTLAQNNGHGDGGDGGGGGSGNLTDDDLKFLEDILGKQRVENILRQTEERLQQNQNERNQDQLQSLQDSLQQMYNQQPTELTEQERQSRDSYFNDVRGTSLPGLVP